MLVLSRHSSEKILIPGLGITLEVISIKGNTVKIGIQAPRDIRILRGELSEETTHQRVAESQIAPVTPPVLPAPSVPTARKKTSRQPLLAYMRKNQRSEKTNPRSATDPAVRENLATYQVRTHPSAPKELAVVSS